MKKIRTHKDAFKAYLAPEKYEYAGCVFCEDANEVCSSCCVEFYCDWGSYIINGVVWPHVEDDDKVTIVRYVLRNCKKWDLKNIERVARKKAIALGYKFEKRTACS